MVISALSVRSTRRTFRRRGGTRGSGSTSTEEDNQFVIEELSLPQIREQANAMSCD
jgi:hypothetical protein